MTTSRSKAAHIDSDRQPLVVTEPCDMAADPSDEGRDSRKSVKLQ